MNDLIDLSNEVLAQLRQELGDFPGRKKSFLDAAIRVDDFNSENHLPAFFIAFAGIELDNSRIISFEALVRAISKVVGIFVPVKVKINDYKDLLDPQTITIDHEEVESTIQKNIIFEVELFSGSVEVGQISIDKPGNKTLIEIGIGLERLLMVRDNIEKIQDLKTLRNLDPVCPAEIYFLLICNKKWEERGDEVRHRVLKALMQNSPECTESIDKEKLSRLIKDYPKLFGPDHSDEILKILDQIKAETL